MSSSTNEDKKVEDKYSSSSSLKRKIESLNNLASSSSYQQGPSSNNNNDGSSSSSFPVMQTTDSSAAVQNIAIQEEDQQATATATTNTTTERPLKQARREDSTNDHGVLDNMNVEDPTITMCTEVPADVVAVATSAVAAIASQEAKHCEGNEHKEDGDNAGLHAPPLLLSNHGETVLQTTKEEQQQQPQQQAVQGHETPFIGSAGDHVTPEQQQEQQFIASQHQEQKQYATLDTNANVTTVTTNNDETSTVVPPPQSLELLSNETTETSPVAGAATVTASSTTNGDLKHPPSEMREASSVAVSVAAAAAAAADTGDAADTPLAADTTSPVGNGDVDRTTVNTNKNNKRPTRLSFEGRLQQLLQYRNANGDCLVPTRFKLNPSLGKWVHNQREQYKLFHKKTKPGYKKKCSMTQERIDKLESVGFLWSTERSKKADEEWMVRFQQLCTYKETHGNTMVPHGYKVDPSLAEWVHRQRTTFALHEKQLSNPDDGPIDRESDNTQKRKKANDDAINSKVQERMAKLESIGFAFCVQDDNWRERWEQLLAYKEQRGHCQVPTHFAENKPLGRWVHTQRHQYRLFLKNKKTCMTQERIDELNKLGFNWEVRPSLEQPRVTWHSRFHELKVFYEKEGHFDVTHEQNASLNRWVQEQKQRLRQLQKHGHDITKRMGPDRVDALESLGFSKGPEI